MERRSFTLPAFDKCPSFFSSFRYDAISVTQLSLLSCEELSNKLLHSQKMKVEILSEKTSNVADNNSRRFFLSGLVKFIYEKAGCLSLIHTSIFPWRFRSENNTIFSHVIVNILLEGKYRVHLHSRYALKWTEHKEK